MITKDLTLIIELLNRNEVVSIPTETVYGLAGNAFSETALEKIFQIKKRPYYNPLILHIHSIDALKNIAADIPAKATKLAEHFWPGPLTLVLNKQKHIPDIATSGKQTVAVRIPNHPVTLELLRNLNYPLAAPSANPFGCISPTSASHVFNYFEHTIPAILDGGECEKGIESTIIGFEEDQPIIYRLGSVSIEEIESLIGPVHSHTDQKDIKSPGMLASHYAPRTKTYLTDNVSLLIEKNKNKKIGLLLYKDDTRYPENLIKEVLSTKGDFNEAAKRLYAAMHRLDNQDIDIIIAELFPSEGIGSSINDRLQRAAIKAN